MKTLSSVLASLLLLVGCAPDLHFGDDSRYLDASLDDGSLMDGAVPPVGGPHVTHAVTELGLFTRVQAHDAETWVYLDLDTGLEVTPTSPEDDDVWDVAFRRSNIATNGGVTGTGGVVVASVPMELAEVTSPPLEGYVSDLVDSDDEDTLPDYAFRNWYLYDVETHVLTPAPITYVVRTTSGAHIALRIASYYDAVGTSGSPSFHSRALP